MNSPSLKKCIMPEGCWFITFKMVKPASGNSDFPLKGSQPSNYTGQKHKLSISRPIGQTLKKIRLLHFLELEKFEKIKWSYCYWFLPQGWYIDVFCFWTVYLFGRNPFKGKYLLLEAGFIIFQIKNHHLSDMMLFLSETKS